jgi:nicotinate dehydrogenase subunit A
VTRLWNSTQHYRRAYVALGGRQPDVGRQLRAPPDPRRRSSAATPTTPSATSGGHIRRTRIELAQPPGGLRVTAFEVNGSPVEIDGDPDTPLLTVLRDDLGLVGTRFGCGQGSCGACFVRLDAAVVPACQTPVWQAEGASVTTVEGLSADGTPHPVQRAILDRQAAQCGFCISGIVVRAAALLDAEPQADAERVASALDGNLCRCGAHRRIIDAVLAAREPTA